MGLWCVWFVECASLNSTCGDCISKSYVSISFHCQVEVAVGWIFIAEFLRIRQQFEQLFFSVITLIKLHFIRKLLDTESAAMLVHAFVTSRFDYCNALYAEWPKTITDKLQWVLNAVTRVVSDTRKFDRGLSALLHDELHWLDVPERITYKLAIMVYHCLHGQAPWYLADHLSPASDVASRLSLCPANRQNFSYPAADLTHTAVGLSRLLVRLSGTRCLEVVSRMFPGHYYWLNFSSGSTFLLLGLCKSWDWLKNRDWLIETINCVYLYFAAACNL